MKDPSEPLQERSRKTLRRILATAEEAALDGGFDELSIREICKRSGVTTGAFYARFEKKDDLAVAMFDVLSTEFRTLVDDHLETRSSKGLAIAVHELLTDAAALYRRRGGLFHALMAKAGKSRELARAMREVNDETFSRLVEPPFPDEVQHPIPALGMRLGYLCVFSALKEIVLDQRFFENAPTIEDDRLVGELTEVFMRYVAQ